MFTMTPNEALIIQRAQMVWYRHSIGRAGIKAIRAATVFPNCHPDKPIPVSDVRIPRGGQFERYIKHYNHMDPNRGAWHNAIRRGLV